MKTIYVAMLCELDNSHGEAFSHLIGIYRTEYQAENEAIKYKEELIQNYMTEHDIDTEEVEEMYQIEIQIQKYQLKF